MGTHGRNAVTINGVHTCYEQRLDGHYAVEDLLSKVLEEGREPIIKVPTMRDETDVCEQEYFTHIDYDKKIIYMSNSDPEEILSKSDDEIKEMYGTRNSIDLLKVIYEKFLRNINKVKKLGWSFVFDTYDCPDEYDCVNSPKNKRR